MPRKKFTNQEMINFLTEAKKVFIAKTTKSHTDGLCCIITRLPNFPHTLDCKNIKYYIKGFNITNAKRLSKKYGFTSPTGHADGFWWKPYCGSRINKESYNARIAFLDALINELKTGD